jgi:hypothetical protein
MDELPKLFSHLVESKNMSPNTLRTGVQHDFMLLKYLE